MPNIMLDLETMGNNPSAAIVAIGAVEFFPKTNTLGAEYYEVVSLDSSVFAGLTMDPSTVLWWLTREKDAQAMFKEKGISLPGALSSFSKWLQREVEQTPPQIWGNGSDFDNVILASAYKALDIPLPWKHWDNRCYRTIKNMCPSIKLKREGTYHNALDDAKSQAKHLMQILQRVSWAD